MVDYIERVEIDGEEAINIAGDSFDGQWVHKHLSYATGSIFGANTTTVFSLKDYLPNDKYDYEVMLNVSTFSADTNNIASYTWVGSGSAMNYIRGRATTVVNRGTYSEGGCNLVILPILKTDQNFCFFVESGCGNTTLWGAIHGYRRLGTSDWANNVDTSHSISFDNSNIAFGGPILSGHWVNKRITLLSERVIEASSARTEIVDLSSYVPNDGYTYMCLFDGTIMNVATQNTDAKLKATVFPDTFIEVGITTCRHTATVNNYCNFIAFINSSNRVLQLRNTGSNNAKFNLRLVSCRRIGANV